MNSNTYVSRNLHKMVRWKNYHKCFKPTIQAINLSERILYYKNYEILIPKEYQVILLGCSDSECGNYILGSNDCELLDSVCENILNNQPENVKSCN